MEENANTGFRIGEEKLRVLIDATSFWIVGLMLGMAKLAGKSEWLKTEDVLFRFRAELSESLVRV